MKYITFGLAIALLASSGGCSGFADLAISTRNHQASYKAWKSARWTYWDQGITCKMREHIGRGFQQGYYDVANGGTGALPLFPPGYYWGPEYQNPRGNEYVAAWFRGYSDGALAADQAGIGGYHALPTSWAPPYASDPDSPDGGFSPYKPPNPLEGGNLQPTEGIPPGKLDTSPILPSPPKPEPKPPVPVPKSVNAPVLPERQSVTIGGLQPTDATQLETPAPTLTAPNAEVKVETPATTTPPAAAPTPEKKTPATKTPVGKQTFLPPGSPKAPLTSEAKTIPRVADSPAAGVKK